MGSQNITMKLSMVMFVVSILVGGAIADTSAKDKEECAEPLAGLATCLTYVGGDAKAPTPDCCNGLKQLLKNKKKCLCVIVKDGNDPEFGLNINITLALGLPSVCHAPANVSQCPALLHLPSNSSDAQVFYQYANSTSKASSIAPSSSAAKGNSTSTSSTIAQVNSGSCCNVKRDGCCWAATWMLLLLVGYLYGF